jgi:septal ring factor EnvC (AmiA/AmiB activator)
MNPKRDYGLALEHLETYALFDPDFANAVDPRLLLAAIIEIERFSALAEAQTKEIQALSQELNMLKRQSVAFRGSRQDIQSANLKLQKRIGQLQKKVRNLETSNAKLNKTIEMLSTLDSRLEEKRINFIKTDSIEEK